MSAPDGWDSVDSELAALADIHRKLYVAYLGAGFTQTEAIRIMAALITATIANQGETSA